MHLRLQLSTIGVEVMSDDIGSNTGSCWLSLSRNFVSSIVCTCPNVCYSVVFKLCDTFSFFVLISFILEPCVESKKGDGREYRGELDYTIDNVTCQYWTSQWPHKHKIYNTENETSNEKKGIGADNFCRNPSGHREKPWCFTTLKDVRWQYCNVNIC